MSSNEDYESEVRRLIELRQGRSVVDLLPRDPLNRFATAFNHAMTDVDAHDIGPAYERPLKTLARKIDEGSIAGFAQLMSMMCAVPLMTAFHFRVKSYHRANPRLRTRRAKHGDESPGTDDGSLPLFLGGGIDPERCVWGGAGPTEAAGRADRFQFLLAEARGLGRLRLAIYRAVREYEWERGTSHGAVSAFARRAVCDPGGRVRGLAKTAPMSPRDLKIERQVRRLYGEALRYLRTRARLLNDRD